MDEIYPCSKLSILRRITVPKVYSDFLHMNISTIMAKAENIGPALALEQKPTILYLNVSSGTATMHMTKQISSPLVRMTFLNTAPLAYR